jgi:hypothetical protein
MIHIFTFIVKTHNKCINYQLIFGAFEVECVDIGRPRKPLDHSQTLALEEGRPRKLSILRYYYYFLIHSLIIYKYYDTNIIYFV